MTKHLLTLLAILLLTSISAQAALTFGTVPAADSMIRSVPQAQRFAAYLEKRLGEPVAMRVFSGNGKLRNALVEQSVDLAMVKGSGMTGELQAPANPDRSEVFVIRSGIDAGLRSRLVEILTAMEQDPNGRALLYGMKLRRFSPADGVNSRKATSSAKPAARKWEAGRSGSAQKPLAGSSWEFGALTFGMVADSKTPLRSKKAVEAFTDKLSRQLKSPITVRIFNDEATLYNWFKRYRMIDLALYPEKFLQGRLYGEFNPLAQPVDLANQGLPAKTWLVASPSLAPRLLERLHISLERIKGAPLASRPARMAGSAPTKHATPTTSPEVIHHAPLSRPSASSTTLAPSKPRSRKLTFGTALAADALLRNKEQANAFACLLGNRLGVTVTAKTFKQSKALHEWLNRYRMVDVGFIDETYLKKQPAGEFIPLLGSNELGGPAGFQLVGRQGLDEKLLDRVRNTLQQMKNDKEVAGLLQDTTPPETVPAAPTAPKAPPVGRPAPVAAAPVTAPPDVKPEPVAVPPLPKLAPPVVPIPPPVVKIPVVVQPPPAAKPEAVTVTPEPKPEPEVAAPTVVPQSETKVAMRPESPEVVFRPPMDREQVFLVPFTTVMVPRQVEERVFDNFVDALNADGMNQRYEFIILKRGLDSVDEAWLAGHNYVTGEVFGYVEESGCCSTDIRTKSRVSMFRKGSDLPVLKHEYPVKTFFDHDYSTMEKERRKIADNIAVELATKVREALGGS